MKDKKELTSKQQKTLAVAAIVIFCLVTVALFVFAGIPMVRFVSEPERFREWVDARGALGRLAYMGMVILQIGAVEGTLLCMAAATLGSLMVFWLVRKFGT